MSNTPIQITTDLSQVLGQINQQLNSLQKEVTDFRTETKIELATIKGNINTLREEVKGDINTLREEVKGDINTLREEVKGDINILKVEVNSIKEDVREIKGAQQAQIWSLIVLAFTTAIGLLGTVVKILIFPNP